jgi:predicted ribosomally synthesized peptide with nif11-like leader
MEKMQKLYEKVANDGNLKTKFTEIMNGAEQAGREETLVKLIAYAKEAGFDVTADEIEAFFKEQSEKKDGELSDLELDMVAGGKSKGLEIFTSIISFGYGCAGNDSVQTGNGSSYCQY